MNSTYAIPFGVLLSLSLTISTYLTSFPSKKEMMSLSFALKDSPLIKITRFYFFFSETIESALEIKTFLLSIYGLLLNYFIAANASFSL